MSSITNRLSTFVKSDKFNSLNWVAFKTIVAIAAEV